MKEIIIKEIVWLLIAAAVFGLLAVVSECKDVLVVGMIVYSAVKISYWYGKLSERKEGLNLIPYTMRIAWKA